MPRINRLAKNAPGDFYTDGDCLQCGLPEEEAPDLLAPVSDDNMDTYFIRQPQTAEEVERACRAILVCCTDSLRYGGHEPAILNRLGNRKESCDFPLPGGPVRFPGEKRFQLGLRLAVLSVSRGVASPLHPTVVQPERLRSISRCLGQRTACAISGACPHFPQTLRFVRNIGDAACNNSPRRVLIPPPPQASAPGTRRAYARRFRHRRQGA